MVAFLLLAILIVLILGFWGEGGLAFLTLLVVGALALGVLAIALILLGISIGSIIQFWNAHRELIEPPLLSLAVVIVWIYAARKFLKFIREKIVEFRSPKKYHETITEKVMFVIVGIPALFIFYGFVLAAFVGAPIGVVQIMQNWWPIFSKSNISPF
ncbi:MAG: hypothetical protein WBX25_02085 [Rhodomicrobium sp.]